MTAPAREPRRNGRLPVSPWLTLPSKDIPRRSWIAENRMDAEKEFAMGDVEEEVFRNFVDSLEQEIEYENLLDLNISKV